MSAVDIYLAELRAALRVRGGARRRVLAECRDHLHDAAAEMGDDLAVERFGDAATLAAQIDIEIAARRALGVTVATAVAVLAVGVSVCSLLAAADTGASASPPWAVAFFACAQTAGASVALALLLAATMRRAATSPGDITVLWRRNITALVSALATVIAAAGAVTGHGSAWQLTAGPLLAVVVAVAVLRLRALIHRRDLRFEATVHTPFADTLTLLRHGGKGAVDDAKAVVLAVPTVVIAAAAAFAWDHLDHGTVLTSTVAAGVEATLALAGFIVLGRVLGLRPGRQTLS